MSTLGRVVVAAVVAGVLIAGTVVAVHYLGGDEDASSLPKPPVKVETPVSHETLGGAGAKAPDAGAAALPVGMAPVTPAGAAKTPAMPVDPPGATVGAGAAGPGEAAADDGLAMMRDRPVQAQKRLSEALRAGIDGPKGAAVREAINSLADKVQLSPQTLPDDPYSKTYQVVSGDALISIGQRFLVPYELVMRVNRMGQPSIAAGQKIKVIQGPFHVEILKSRHELQAWLGDVCVRVYQVGIGSADKTPDGTFVVKSKLKNPPYQPQHKTKADFRAAGAPDNPLGTRWIDIGNHFGIHGTIDPSSIGRNVSEGCIRMHNKEVEELYDLVVMGATKVTIKP